MKTNGIRMLGGLVVTASILTVGCVVTRPVQMHSARKPFGLYPLNRRRTPGRRRIPPLSRPTLRWISRSGCQGTSWRSIARKAPTAEPVPWNQVPRWRVGWCSLAFGRRIIRRLSIRLAVPATSRSPVSLPRMRDSRKREPA